MKIWLSPPHLSDKEKLYVLEAIDSGWITSLGPQINSFEEHIRKFTGASNAISVSTGTAGLHLALLSLGIKPEDRIACSSLTFAATANAIKYIGANPVFIDSELDTWNMDPQLLKESIEDSIKNENPIKAIILVHIFGMPAKIDQIFEIANHYDIPVIEDAAESLGSKFDSIPTGRFGKIGVFSFNGNKIITTSGGGAMISENADLINQSKFLGTQAKNPVDWYEHEEIGYNYRMSNILAAIGIAQMEVLEDRVKRKREINQRYRELLSDLPIRFQSEPDSRYDSNYWLTCVTFESNEIMMKIHQALKSEEIESRRIWKPMHAQPVYNTEDKYINGTSDLLFDVGLSLPSGTKMTDEDLEKITSIIRKCID
jgi:dTDP-4-amino-4,6-dideoxygalactose transaminase